ncbi:MAG: hypothetical protein RLZZ232_2380 [Planctomycetota bacterium]|jgi:hypothetical protein
MPLTLPADLPPWQCIVTLHRSESSPEKPEFAADPVQAGRLLLPAPG